MTCTFLLSEIFFGGKIVGEDKMEFKAARCYKMLTKVHIFLGISTAYSLEGKEGRVSI